MCRVKTGVSMMSIHTIYANGVVYASTIRMGRGNPGTAKSRFSRGAGPTPGGAMTDTYLEGLRDRPGEPECLSLGRVRRSSGRRGLSVSRTAASTRRAFAFEPLAARSGIIIFAYFG